MADLTADDEYARDRYGSDIEDAELVSTGLHGLQITDEGGDEESNTIDVGVNVALASNCVRKADHRPQLYRRSRIRGDRIGKTTSIGLADLETKRSLSYISHMAIRHPLNGIIQLQPFWLKFPRRIRRSAWPFEDYEMEDVLIDLDKVLRSNTIGKYYSSSHRDK